MAKKAAVKTTAKAEVIVHGVHTPFNAPKPNSISQACTNLAEITSIALNGDGTNLSKFGHIAYRKNGVIDACILSGKASTMQDLIRALKNHNVSADDRLTYSEDTLDAVLAHRVFQHVDWCAKDSQKHGAFASRLEKVGMLAFKEAITMNLTELATMLKNTYDVQYAKLYTKRAHGLLSAKA